MQVQTIFLGLAAVCCFSACDKAGFSYDNVTDGGNVSYTLLDTLEIKMSTIQPDSIPTSGTGTALIGTYSDTYFGRTVTGSYCRIGLPGSREIADEAIYDSIELIMVPNGYYYGDTLPVQTIQVHQLTEQLEMPDDYTYMFGHMRVPYNNTPLASRQYQIYPTSGDTLHMRLPNAKGAELFNMLKAKHSDVSTDDLFHEYFKGLYIQGGSNNSAVFGLKAADSSLYIRLHYHIVTHEIEEAHIDFMMSKPEVQFNTVTTDRRGTPLAKLQPGAGLPTSETGSLAYLQSISGALVRMDFPSLPSLLELGRFGRIMRAELLLRPVNGTFSNKTPLPPRLTLGLADNTNWVAAGDTLPSSLGTTQYGNLSQDPLYPENTRYSYDVTAYCKTMINTDTYKYRGLLLCPPSSEYSTQLNRLVLGDGSKTAYRAELKIYYLLYQ